VPAFADTRAGRNSSVLLEARMVIVVSAPCVAAILLSDASPVAAPASSAANTTAILIERSGIR
jgi:hypothetical protein